MQPEPDFSPRPQPKIDWSINLPTIFSVIGGAGTVAFFFVSLWSDAKVERNDMNWKIRSLEAEYTDSKKYQEEQRQTIKQLTDSLLLTNQSLAHTAQLVEWISKNPYQAAKP